MPVHYGKSPSRRQKQLDATEEPGTRYAGSPMRKAAPAKAAPARAAKASTLSGQSRVKKAVVKSSVTGRRTTRAELNTAAGRPARKPKTGK